MVAARITILNTKNNGKYIRYARRSTIGDCVKVCLNHIDQSTPLGQLPDIYEIKVELNFHNMETVEETVYRTILSEQ